MMRICKPIFVYIFILGGMIWQVLEHQGPRHRLILAKHLKETGQVVYGDMVDVQSEVTV